MKEVPIDNIIMGWNASEKMMRLPTRFTGTMTKAMIIIITIP